MARLLITGANGHLGRRLINALPGGEEIEALVRSDRARRSLEKHCGTRAGLNVTVADPGDPAVVAEIAGPCDRAVHLIGTIRETRDNRYVDAHERPARALAAAPSLKHVVYVSILGADPRSRVRCLRSRAAVESILEAAAPAATVIRVPMVLGEADRASFALARRAAAARVILFRAASLEQPIYAGDVIEAIKHALRFEAPADVVFDLAGPESVSRGDLVLRAAATLGRRPSVLSLPLALGLGLAFVLECLRSRPPLTRDMLRILDHDDAIEPAAAAAALGVSLTPLDEMLRRCIPNRLAQATT